jgi:HD-GYP domain-containing protein (c-di-GMP phosphodiesterase class II)
MMRNPFYNRGPIREPRFFFERGKETREILRLLAGTQNCSIMGPVKSGKTSLLLHLARPATLAAQGVSPVQHGVVYLSFEGLGTLTAEQFFHLMVRETARQKQGKVMLMWPRFEARDEMSFLELRDVLDQIEVGGERLVFFLDEVEVAAKNPAFDLHFFSALRHIAARPGVCFVTATERRLHDLEIAGREVGSPFADLFSVVRLRPLDEETAWESVSRLAAEAGVDLTPERDLILELGGGWPFHLQVVAHEVFERRSGGSALTEEQRLYVRAAAYEELEPVLSMMWARLKTGERQAALAAPSKDRGAPEVEGLTIRTGSQVRPVNALVSRFLTERRQDQDARLEDYLAQEDRTPNRAMMYGVVRSLMRAVEARDQYMRGHADRVARLAAAIAEEMGCSREQTEEIRLAARVHEVGRVSISDMILLKPGPLTEIESEIIRTHPLVGAQILDALQFPWSVKPTVRYHHERMDGSGYPEGLVGEEIPVAARVLAVADVLAAMTADRPYRPAQPEAEAMAELTAYAGSKYDAGAVAALERVLSRGGA